MIQLPITIEVKQEHIDKGVRHDCKKCVIALAIRDAFKEHEGVLNIGVGFNLATVYHTKVEFDRVYELPQRVTKFIDDFDKGNKVQPFSFTIEKVY